VNFGLAFKSEPIGDAPNA
nr:outer sheath protein [Treponema denticola, Peptide Partial, 18 aa] [Treponema denticola]